MKLSSSHFVRAALSLALLVSAGPWQISALGQQAPAAAADKDATPVPTLQQNPLTKLKDFEPAADEEYTLGGGDEISLEFPGRPELSSKHVIGPDGRITLPLAGDIQLANLTREAAAAKIVEALTPFYTSLAVTVRIDKYGSNRILLLGAVKNPGIMYFDQTPTLLEAVTRGGLPTGPDNQAVIPERCAIYRGSDQVMWVDLRTLLETGNPLADLRLRRNDVVFLPSGDDRVVSILGAVHNPGAVRLTRGSTLISLISQVGGPTDQASSNAQIQVVQPSTGKTTYVPFKELLKADSKYEVTLHPGDIIYVPKSGLAKASWFMQQIAPLTMIGTFAAIAR